eukprot:2130367-Prymnesium_polylepis.1
MAAAAAALPVHVQPPAPGAPPALAPRPALVDAIRNRDWDRAGYLAYTPAERTSGRYRPRTH